MFANCLSLANSGSVGACFYHPYKFVASDHVTALVHSGADSSCYLALSVLVGRLGEKYNFNREINDGRISRERIMLPVTDEGAPDYDYMSYFVESKREEMLGRYKSYITEKLGELEYKDIPTLDEIGWDDFELDSIADVDSGRDIYAQERINGKMPYITSGTANNGIGYFVANDNKSKAKNAISVNRNGAVGEAFYHPYSALYGNDCRRVTLRESRNPYVQLFVVRSIVSQCRAFSYSRKLGTERLKKLRIMLPVNENGAPDYNYMKQYAMNIVMRKCEQYLAFINRNRGFSELTKIE